MSNLIQLYFHLKIPKNHTSGPIPIYAIIFVKGKRTEISLNRKCEAERWCRKSERVNGNREAVRKLNKFIEQFQIKVYDAQEFLQRDSEEITIEDIRGHILGKKQSIKTILDVFEDHNKKVEALVGKEFAEGTLERYKTSLKHTRDFINWKYKVSDLDIRKVDHEFVTE